MRRYKIKIEEVRITEFDVDAKNKKVAQEIVKDILFNTNILNLKCVEHNYVVRLAIKPKKGNQYETNC